LAYSPFVVIVGIRFIVVVVIFWQQTCAV